MKKLKYSQYNKFDITPFAVLIFGGIIIFYGTIFFARVLNTITTLPKEVAQTETQVQPEQEPEPKEVQEEPEQEPEPTEEDNSEVNDTPQPVHKEVAKPIPVVEPKTVAQQPKTPPKPKPRNVIANPDEYLNYVYNKLSKALPQYNTGGYTINGTILLTSQREIKILDDDWNGDVGHNFVFYNLNLIPKYYDENGRVKPLVIKFKAHSVDSVQFY